MSQPGPRGDEDRREDLREGRGQDEGQDEGQDRACFEVLARQVIEPVRRYLARRTDPTTAADVLSEVLLVLWRRLEDVPLQAPLPYAYTVARNCLHNAQRSALRQQRLAERIAVVDPPAHTVPAHHDDPDHPDHADHAGQDPGSGRGVDEQDVHLAIASLPAASAEVVRLWAWEQLAPAQIAQVVGSSANAVSIRLHRAKKQLAAALTPAPAPAPPPLPVTTPPAHVRPADEHGGPGGHRPGRPSGPQPDQPGQPPGRRADTSDDRDRRTP